MGGSVRGKLATLAVAACALGVPTRVLAGPAPSASTPTTPAIADVPQVQVLVGSGVDPSLVRALDAASVSLESQGVELIVARIESHEISRANAADSLQRSQDTGVFWLIIGRDAIEVWLLDERRIAYVRRVPTADGLEETAREEVWHIIEAGALALASGDPIAMEAAPPPPAENVEAADTPADVGSADIQVQPHVAASPDAEEPERVSGGIAIVYVGEGVADPLPWQSGAGITGFLDAGKWARVAIDYDMAAPTPDSGSTVRWRHRGSARAGIHAHLGARWGVAALAGLDVEAQRWRSLGGPTQGWRTIVAARADLGVTFRIVGPLSLWLEPGVAVPLNRFDFLECQRGSSDCEGAERRVVLAPWLVRPRIRVGVSIALPG